MREKSNQSTDSAYTELSTTREGNQAYSELSLTNNTTETRRGGSQTYTELDIASVSKGASTGGNQYDSLSQQNNYINLNTS
jgi:hypothetical protein